MRLGCRPARPGSGRASSAIAAQALRGSPGPKRPIINNDAALAAGIGLDWLVSMFATAAATHHYRARADERALPDRVEAFLRTWGTETWAAGATQITLVRDELPLELQESREARQAEDWVLVAGDNGALLTCYRRRRAWRFIRRKREANRRRGRR
jgi:hypothetical protein